MIAVPADGRPGRAMFLTSLTPRFWPREEARARGGSLAIAVLAHAVLLALLLRVGAGRSPAPSEETTTWLLIGPPGPGGGVVPLAEPGAAEPEEATPEESDVEEVVEDFPEEPIAEIEAVAPVADSEPGARGIVVEQASSPEAALKNPDLWVRARARRGGCSGDEGRGLPTFHVTPWGTPHRPGAC